MRIESISTTSFRNLHDERVTFAPRVNLLVGENGQGKTNLLEAIYLFKFGRSFRTYRDAEMIRFGDPFCRAEVSYGLDDTSTVSLAVAIERDGRKTIKIDAEELARLSDLVGRFPVVLFGPHDLDLVSGGPSERRRFIDMVGSMTDRAYMDLLRTYRRILGQRNAALKAHANTTERGAWTSELVAHGSNLIVKRCELAASLNADHNEHARQLGAPFGFHLAYDSAIYREAGGLTENGTEPSTGDLATVFEGKLAALEREEQRRGTTLAGPHRDDLGIEMDGKDLRRFGSQGQRRLCAVLLKLAEMSRLEKMLGETCVLLLDDVFSEFDRDITAKLQEVLGGDRQVFVTSPLELGWATAQHARVFRVAGGRAST